MQVRAVIFDLDGTLLNTLDDLMTAVNHALGAVALPPLSYNEARAFVGNGVPRLIERAITHVKGGDAGACDKDGFVHPTEFDACLSAFTKYYDAHSADATRLYDGVRDVLTELKTSGIKTAVVTNKYDAAAQKLRLEFFPETDAVVGTSDTVRPKPAPDGVKRALEILGVTAGECVFVGDGETDVATAKNCGIPVIAVTWGFRDRARIEPLGPDRIIDSPKELIAAINAIRTGGAK